MHKILSVRFLLKFSHFFLLGPRVASFLLALGNLHFPYRFADSSGYGIGSPAGNRAQIQTHKWARPDHGVSNNPCGNAKM